MGANSKIEWTHHTFNPWIGCSKVSPGCTNCYAEEMMDKRYGKAQWGPRGTRVRTSEANWRKPLQWDKAAAATGERHRVFCASLADVFEDRPELVEWRFDLFSLIEVTPNLDWLLLTKRPENVNPMLRTMVFNAYGEEPARFYGPMPIPNLWIGTSVENQEQADKRIPELLKIPAKVRFLSMEPLLGPVDLRKIKNCGVFSSFNCLHRWTDGKTATGIDWVIVGGESGHNARPMHPDWARSLRNQCQVAGVPFHFKQHGEWTDADNLDDDWEEARRYHWPDSISRSRTKNPPNHCIAGDTEVVRVGKHAAGRLLDGRTWDEVPL